MGFKQVGKAKHFKMIFAQDLFVGRALGGSPQRRPREGGDPVKESPTYWLNTHYYRADYWIPAFAGMTLWNLCATPAVCRITSLNAVAPWGEGTLLIPLAKISSGVRGKLAKASLRGERQSEGVLELI